MTYATIPSAICDALLFFSRLRIPDAEKNLARDLCSRIDDWPLFTARAAAKFSLPMIYRNLRTLDMDNDLAPELAALHMQTIPITFGGLRAQAALRSFHDDFILPLGVDHVYLKGPTLAAQFYDDPGLRFARDIDVLVSKRDQARIVARASDMGYELVDCTHNQVKKVPSADQTAFLKYKTVATLTTPDRIVIEVHRDIDKRLGIFNAPNVIADANSFDGLGMMPFDDLFCYICYHNSRHMWSRLHWLVDLDAMITHRSFDAAKILAHADGLGLAKTVAACLDLHSFAVSGHASQKATGRGHGAELLVGCIKNLGGDLDLEYDLRKGETLLGLPFDWMVNSPVRHRAQKMAKWSKITPSYEDYEAWRLPAYLHWLYYVSKPVGAARRQMHRLLQRSSEQSLD